MWGDPLQPIWPTCEGGQYSVPVDLWFWPLRVDETRLAALARHLSADEIARANRFVQDRDRRHFITARGRMREILSDVLDRAPGDLAFGYTTQGKPVLPDGPAFNLSHSGGWAVLALGAGPAVGIDIEARRPVERALAALVGSARELQVLQGLPDPDWTRGFFRLWTRKEAYLKGCGAGLSRALGSVDVAPDQLPDARVSRITDEAAYPTDWIVTDLDLGPDFHGAVATQGQPRLRLMSPETGIQACAEPARGLPTSGGG